MGIKFEQVESCPDKRPKCPECYMGRLTHDKDRNLWICNGGLFKCQRTFKRTIYKMTTEGLTMELLRCFYDTETREFSFAPTVAYATKLHPDDKAAFLRRLSEWIKTGQ